MERGACHNQRLRDWSSLSPSLAFSFLCVPAEMVAFILAAASVVLEVVEGARFLGVVAFGASATELRQRRLVDGEELIARS